MSPRALAPWLLLAPLALAAGCDDASRAPFSIEVVTAAGTNPVAGATTGRLHVLVAQDGQPTRDQAADLSGGTFQLDVTIASYGTPTRLGVELVRDGVTSLGAVPTFAPLGFAFVRVPVVPVGTCATVATQRLATPRARAAVASIDALVAVVGGLAGDGTAAPGIERFWSPQLTASEGSGSVHPSAFPAGPARALRFAGQPRLLVLSSGASVVDFGGDATEPVSTLTGLHAGAGEASALVDLVASGVAIVGGDDAAAISWVGVDRSVQTSALPTARADAAATGWGASEGILIAGGNAEGEPVLVYVPAGAAAREDVVTFELPGTPGRASRGGALLRSPDGAAALYLGALDAAGVVSTETWVVRGCPRACEVEPGPSWPEAREGFAVAETSTGAWIVGGREGATPSARVERIVWSAGTPVLEPSSLVTARDEAAVTALAGGMVLVVGGRGAERALESFELCAPGTLEPI